MGQISSGTETFFEAVGGLPFIDFAFQPDVLLSVVAGIRRQFDPIAYESLVEYLDPANARVLFVRFGHCQMDEPQTTQFDETELKQIADARSRILRVQPEWTELFELPVEFRKLIDSRTSVTSALIPQVIFLGQSAFATSDALAEVLVHELAHVWLNLLGETLDFQTKDATKIYRLPSGTSGKTTRGVLLAAHFAASAHAFHVRLPSGASRADYLHRYLTECLDLLCFSKDITAMGRFVLENLGQYASETREPIGREGNKP